MTRCNLNNHATWNCETLFGLFWQAFGFFFKYYSIGAFVYWPYMSYNNQMSSEWPISLSTLPSALSIIQQPVVTIPPSNTFSNRVYSFFFFAISRWVLIFPWLLLMTMPGRYWMCLSCCVGKRLSSFLVKIPETRSYHKIRPESNHVWFTHVATSLIDRNMFLWLFLPVPMNSMENKKILQSISDCTSWCLDGSY